MTGAKPSREEVAAFFLSTAKKLLALQLASHHEDPKEVSNSIAANKLAAGYVFGFQDAFLDRFQLIDALNPNAGLSLLRDSYQYIFGNQAGLILFQTSVNSQHDPDFQRGRQNGGNELVEYMESGTPPFGLSRILFVGLGD
jgi:hypothetical protein